MRSAVRIRYPPLPELLWQSRGEGCKAMKKTAIKDVDAYIAAQPKNVAAKLKQLRQTVRSAAPEAQEIISYGMPAYKYHGRLVYFGAFKNHISFYPRPSGSTTLQKRALAIQRGERNGETSFGQAAATRPDSEH